MIGAAGVALLTIGVAAQAGAIHLPPAIGGGGPIAGRLSNPAPLTSPSPDASPTPQPSPQASPAPQVQVVSTGGHHGRGHGKGH